LTLCILSSSHPTKAPHQGQSSCTLTKLLRQVASPSGLAKSTRPLAPPTCHFKSARHVSSPSRQFKFARQVDYLCSLTKSPHPSPQRVDSLSHLTKSADPMVLPPCLRKLARYCACQVAPLRCFSKPTHLVGSPTRLFKYARQVGLPSHPTMSCHQVDCSSTLAKLTLHFLVKSPHQSASSRSVFMYAHHVASPSCLAEWPR
jgi:hypothetical protein